MNLQFQFLDRKGIYIIKLFIIIVENYNGAKNFNDIEIFETFDMYI